MLNPLNPLTIAMELLRQVGPERGAAYALKIADQCCDDGMREVYQEVAELLALSSHSDCGSLESAARFVELVGDR